MLVIGLMSGTSADGVDAALVEWPDDARASPFVLRAFQEHAFDAALQERIHRMAAAEVPGPDALRELAALDVALGERFAEAALALMEKGGVAAADVRAIASHGQTVAHHPELAATLQIGNASVLAERTGCTVVADFRPRDMAAGGEGAPLAPFFHWAALANRDENRVALNLGGIANCTWLPAGEDPGAVRAFDVGPANALLDGVIRTWTDGAERFDRDGSRARRGRVDDGLLDRLLDDEFLRRPPPKSTGRERYGKAEARALASEWRHANGALDDLLATLVAFNAEAVARACRDFLGAGPGASSPLHRVLVCGGGAANAAQCDALAERLPGVAVEASDAAGVPYQAVEAMAFSLMGRNALLGLPNHLPACTGARRPAVLGQLVPASDGHV